jgi:hypothetical protein
MYDGLPGPSLGLPYDLFRRAWKPVVRGIFFDVTASSAYNFLDSSVVALDMDGSCCGYLRPLLTKRLGIHVSPNLVQHNGLASDRTRCDDGRILRCRGSLRRSAGEISDVGRLLLRRSKDAGSAARLLCGQGSGGCDQLPVPQRTTGITERNPEESFSRRPCPRSGRISGRRDSRCTGPGKRHGSLHEAMSLSDPAALANRFLPLVDLSRGETARVR